MQKGTVCYHAKMELSPVMVTETSLFPGKNEYVLFHGKRDTFPIRQNGLVTCHGERELSG